MKKLTFIACLALVFCACQESLEERCAREAKEYTLKNCPSKMSENIIIDSLTFEAESHTLHYYYRLTGIADRDSVLTQVNAVTTLREALKNTTSMKTYKDAGYNFSYTYRSDKQPEKIYLEVTLTKEDYDLPDTVE